MRLSTLSKVVLFSLLFSVVGTQLEAEEKEATPKKISIPFRISPSGHQLVTLELDGKPVEMILDTAAGANVFSDKATKKFKLDAKDSEEKVAGLGTTTYAVKDVTPVTLTIDKKQFVVRNIMSMDLSHVASAAGERFCGLLGSPFFRRYNAVLDFSTNTLVITLPTLP